MTDVTKNVGFNLRVSADADNEREFKSIVDRIEQIEKRASNIRLRVTGQGGSAGIGSTSTTFAGIGAAASVTAMAGAGDRAVAQLAKQTRERERLAAQNEKAVDRLIKSWDRQALAEQRAAEREQRQRATADAQIARWQRQADDQEKKERDRDARNSQKDYQQRLRAGNRQLATLVASGAAAQRDDQLAANARMAGYQQDRDRADRAAGIATAHEREELLRTREAAVSTADAISHAIEGIGYFGLIGQRDIAKLTDRLLALRGVAESVRGLSHLFSLGRGGMMTGATRAAGIGTVGALGAGTVAAGALAMKLALMQSSGGHDFVAGLGGMSQSLHGFTRRLEQIGMAPEERQAYQRRQLTQLEDVNRPYGWGMGDIIGAPGHLFAEMLGERFRIGGGLAHDLNADAANQRNTERLSRITSDQIRQREGSRQIEGLQLGVDLQRDQMAREMRDLQADVERRRRGFSLRAQLTTGFLRGGQTGIGRADGAFGAGSAFNDGSIIRDRGERMRFLQGRRDLEVERRQEADRLQQRLSSADLQYQGALDRRRHLGSEASPNIEAQAQVADTLKRIDAERMQIRREMFQLTQRMNQQDVHDSAKLVALAAQRAQTVQGKFGQRLGAQQDFQARLGRMQPLQVAALAETRRRLEAGQPVAREQLELAEQIGDERTRFLANQEFRRRGREQEKLHPELGSQERFMAAAAGREAEQTAGQRDRLAKELSGATNQVVISGDATITLDVRHDLQAVEGLSEVERALGRMIEKNNEQIMKAVQAAADNAAASVMKQIRGGGSTAAR